MMDSLLAQWQPRPVQAVKRFQSITFGGLTLEGTKSWKFYDIEHDATVTASVTPRAVRPAPAWPERPPHETVACYETVVTGGLMELL